MMSENAVNGRPNGASGHLMDWFRRRGFEGFFTTDCGGIEDIRRETGAPSWVNATAQAVNAGISIECPGDTSYMKKYLPLAIQQGLVHIDQVDRSLERTLSAVIDLGVLDPPSIVRWANLAEEALDSEEHRQLALTASQQSLVLLRNERDTLPLRRNARVALTGPYAFATNRLLGQSDYHGVNKVIQNRSILDELRRRHFNVVHVKGCKMNRSIPHGVADAVAAAKVADVVVIALGLDERFEDEGLDRFNLDLPMPQLELLEAVAGTGTPVVLLLVHGGALSLEKHLAKTSAIIDAFYPGQFGGVALAQLLAGELSPSGALPISYYPANYTRRNMTNFDLRSFDGTTYQHYRPQPVFPFGFGLSYTRFAVRSLHAGVLRASTAVSSLAVEVEVSNIGAFSSAVPLLAFVRHASSEFPRLRLGSFSRIHLTPGETQGVHLVIPREAFLSTDEAGSRKLYAGTYTVSVREAVVTMDFFGPTILAASFPFVAKRPMPDTEDVALL